MVMKFRSGRFAFFLIPAVILISCHPPTGVSTLEEVETPAPTQTETYTSSPTKINPETKPSKSPEPTNSFSPALQFNSWEIVNDLAFSPNGDLLAVSAGNTIHVYDASSLVELYSIPIGVWANRLAFHPTLPLLALAAKDGTVEFRETESGKLICKFSAHNKGAISLSINPDGNLLATTGTDIKSRLWDISSLIENKCEINEMGSFIGESYSSPDVEFSPDGESIALVDLTNIRLRSSSDRKLIALLDSPQTIFDIAFSPDGHWLASAGDQSLVTTWDLNASPKPVKTEWELGDQNVQSFIWRVVFSPDSRTLAVGTSDGKIVLLDLASAQKIMEYSLPRSVTALAFSPDGQFLAAGGLDSAVWLFPIIQK